MTVPPVDPLAASLRRGSTRFLAVVGLLGAGWVAMVLHARRAESHAAASRRTSAALVRSLGLTDLCLFTEARYTRHPAMADRHAPFQDQPMGLDHFPSGSLVAPPTFPSRHAQPHPALPPHP